MSPLAHRSQRLAAVVLTAVILLAAFPAASSEFERGLERQLKGAWAILEVDVTSSCSSTYSDNRVSPAGVTGKADRRFEPGELVKIDKVKVKRSRVDLLISIAEPILASHRDGPFELYEEKRCRVQLIFDFPRAVIKGGDADAVIAVIGSALTRHSSRAEATSSEGWNRRKRDPYPPGYEQTLVRYEIWKAEQVNAAVSAGLEKAAEETAEVVDDIEQDPGYLDGFATGAEKMRSIDIDGCSRLIDATYSGQKDRPPSDKSKTWKRGFEDGQSLVFHVYMLRKLRLCFVPVPDAPMP
jgi:hypothetical protein